MSSAVSWQAGSQGMRPALGQKEEAGELCGGERGPVSAEGSEERVSDLPGLGWVSTLEMILHDSRGSQQQKTLQLSGQVSMLGTPADASVQVLQPSA